MLQSQYTAKLDSIAATVAELKGVQNIEPDQPPTEPLTVDAGPDVVTEVGKSVTFTATVKGGKGPYQFRWAALEQNTNGTLSFFTAKYDTPGKYIVSVAVVDADGTRAGDSVVVTVKGVEPPPPAVVNVGPSGAFAEPHLVPWSKLQPNTTVNVVARQIPYASKLVLQRNDVTIKGVEGRPVFDAYGAIENTDWNTDWTSQLVGKGLISIIKPTASGVVKNTRLENLEIRGARAGKFFKYKDGGNMPYQIGVGGVYAVTCDGVEITNCVFSDNDNNIFAVSNDSWGVVRNLAVRWCVFDRGGVAGSDRQHGAYIEGIGTIYEFNSFFALTPGAAGALLKDRSAGAIVRYNRFTGPTIRHLDLVEPESGEAWLTTSPQWGQTHVYGNLFQNDIDCAWIHFGFDGTYANRQRELRFYNNTLKNVGDNWKFSWFKLTNSQLYALNNIFWNHSSDSARVYLASAESVWMPPGGWNFLSAGTMEATDANGVAVNNGTVQNFGKQLFGNNPGVNPDMTLRPDAVCRGKGSGTLPTAWMPVLYGWNGSAWQPRTSLADLGAAG